MKNPSPAFENHGAPRSVSSALLRGARGRRSSRIRCEGYSLVEVLVAAVILLMAIGAAAALAVALSHQEDSAAADAIGVNTHEQIGRLWQLGLSQTEIEAVLPPDPSMAGLEITESDHAMGTGWNIRRADSVFQFRLPESGREAGGSVPVRTNSLLLVRDSGS